MADWIEGPSAPSLRDREVHIWSVDLTLGTQQAAEILSQEEKERARKFRSPLHQTGWSISHGATRQILSRYTHQVGSELAISKTEEGKPYLLNAELHFNLSHSGDVALVVVSRDVSLGVDIEECVPLPALMEIAERVLPKESIARIANLAGNPQLRCFYEEWTRHEATTKCAGTGIVEPGGALPVVWCHVVSTDTSYVAAVATSDAPTCVQFFRFTWPSCAGSVLNA